MMVAANQFMSRKCLSIGNLVAREKEIQELTVKDVKEAFKVGNENSDITKKIMNGLRYYGQTIKGSDSYFHQKTKEMLSILEHIRIRSAETQMMNLFVTYSCADLHANEIHERIPGSEKYLGKTIVAKAEDIPTGADRSEYLTRHEDFMLRQGCL